MSQFYKARRNPEWNYGGKNWKLSRSKIDLFRTCRRCFYVDNKLGTARPPGYPFNLNSAVDALLKKEFDVYRARGQRHPLAAKYGVDAVPFAHDDLNEWRENFTGVRYLHGPTGFLVTGAVDDVWKNPAGELIVVDYKSTSKDSEVNLDAAWQDGYKRQMEVYQWLLRRKGFRVSDTGYFVYANGRTDRAAFDARLEFEVTLLSYTGDDSWIEGTLGEIKQSLDSAEIPASAPECDFCAYRNAANAVEAAAAVKTSLSAKAGVSASPSGTPTTLF